MCVWGGSVSGAAGDHVTRSHGRRFEGRMANRVKRGKPWRGASVEGRFLEDLRMR